MPEVKYSYATEDRPIATSLCQPACRLLLVSVEAYGPEPSHDVTPVIALRSTIIRRFGKRYRQGEDTPIAPSTEKEMLANGWFIESQHEETRALCISADGFIDPIGDWTSSEGAYRVVACPWPPEEDNQRLRPIIEEMAESLRPRSPATP